MNRTSSQLVITTESPSIMCEHVNNFIPSDINVLLYFNVDVLINGLPDVTHDSFDIWIIIIKTIHNLFDIRNMER